MAIASYVGTEIDANTSTFDSWLVRTNDIITDLGSVVLSTGNNNIGNTALTGIFSANTIVVGTDLRGGDHATPAAFNVSSNTHFTAGLVSTAAATALETNGNVTVTGSTRIFTISNANTNIQSAYLNVNSTTYFNSPVDLGNSGSANNITVSGTLTVNTLDITGSTSFVDLSITGTATVANASISTLASDSLSANNVSASGTSSLTVLKVTGQSTFAAVAASSVDVSANTSMLNLAVSGNTSTETFTANTSTLNSLTVNGTTTANTVNGKVATFTGLTVTGTGAIKVPVGATLQRPTAERGMIRFNTTTELFEGYDGYVWGDVGEALLQQMATNGFIVKTGDGTVAPRAVAVGNGLLISDGDGVAGNPTISPSFASDSEVRSGAANKIVNASTLYTAYAPVVQDIGTTSYTPNLNNGRNFVVTLTGNRIQNNPNSQKPGQSGRFIIKQDATGGRTLSFGADYKFAGGSDPTLSTAPNAIDVISYFVDSVGVILCKFEKNFA